MTTIRLNGTFGRNFIADELIRLYGSEEALKKVCGPMREALEEEIEYRKRRDRRPAHDSEQGGEK